MPEAAAEQNDQLSPLIIDGTLAGEYRLRRDEYEYVSIHPSKEEEFITKGWELYVHGQSRVRLKRRKLHDVLLEDRMWLLLYRMGYPVISGKNFRVAYKRPDGSSGFKQVDVFAKDDETSLIVECKSCEQRRKRTLQKDLHETEALKKPIADAIRRQFGPAYKPKIIWLYVTSNVIWSEQDVERAEGSGIRIITENDLQYFEAFISHIGTAGRYQFLAEFLQGTEIPNLTNVKVPAVKGTLGKHTFYSFAITPRHLLKIAFVNHQALKPSRRATRVPEDDQQKPNQEYWEIYRRRRVLPDQHTLKLRRQMPIRLTAQGNEWPKGIEIWMALPPEQIQVRVGDRRATPTLRVLKSAR